jgi:hypothetical protein
MERNSWGFSLFCDDIRSELGGKLSVMGIYQTDMVFPQNIIFPFIYPKFCILIKYYEVQNVFTDDLTIRVFLPGDVKDLPSINLPLSSLNRNTSPPYPLEDDQERIFNVTFPLTLIPFPIKQEGFVKVRVECGGVIINLGSLMIRKAREDESISFPLAPIQPA